MIRQCWNVVTNNQTIKEDWDKLFDNIGRLGQTLDNFRILGQSKDNMIEINYQTMLEFWDILLEIIQY